MQNNDEEEGEKKKSVRVKVGGTCESADVCENRHVCAQSVCAHCVRVLAPVRVFVPLPDRKTDLGFIFVM